LSLSGQDVFSGMAPLLSIAFLATFLSAQALSVASVDNKTYEYIVVGSGPGGGPIASNLARAGHSVLLIEAGDDQTENVS
jgi:choline dehydrogenase